MASLFAFGSLATAGELDREGAAKSLGTTPGPQATVSGSELDRESPTPAYHWHGGWGGYRHFGWGYRPYFGGFYSPFGFGGFNAFGGWGYRPFYSGFYRPFFGRYVGFSPFGFYGYPWYW
jgi:hypothetical protein